MAVRVAFLGSGDAFNARARCHAGYLLSAPSSTLLLDCGPTTPLAMRRDGVALDTPDAILISHLHGDHFAGLPFLFLTYIFETPRRRPLTIVGPPGTEARVHDLYHAMYRDLSTRPLPFELRYIEVTGGQHVTLGGGDLLPFAVPHQKTELSLGYRLTIDGKVVLYSGDSGWTEAFVMHSRGADLFICECVYYETRTDFHLDYPCIAENRARLGCRQLILTHLGREVLAHEREISEQLAYDGLVTEL